MLRALSTAATGMDAEQTRLDVTANNIANVATPGFKKSRAEFEDVMYQRMKAAGAPGSGSPIGLEIGMGVRVAGTARSEGQGELKQTSNPLDLAIEGPGYFAVKLPNGGAAYTRDGAFRLDAERRIVTHDGLALAGDLSVPPDATSISIAPDGMVSAILAGDATPMELGKIELATFANPAGLTALGHNRFGETAASGSAIDGAPGQNGTGTIQQGSLELSNVKIVEEMIDLIAGQRAYEVSSRVVRAADEMLQQTTNLR